MTIYECDSCGGETPGGAIGTTFLVKSDAHTLHFCSSACLRAHVNGRPLPANRNDFFVTVASLTILIHIFISYYVISHAP